VYDTFIFRVQENADQETSMKKVAISVAQDISLVPLAFSEKYGEPTEGN
jgi:hypothetical protein